MREAWRSGAAMLVLTLMPAAALATTSGMSAGPVSFIPPSPPGTVGMAVAFVPPAPPAQAPQIAAAVAFLPPTPPAAAAVGFVPPAPPAQVPGRVADAVGVIPPTPPAQMPGQVAAAVGFIPPAPPAQTTVAYLPPAPPAQVPDQVAASTSFIPPVPPASAPQLTAAVTSMLPLPPAPPVEMAAARQGGFVTTVSFIPPAPPISASPATVAAAQPFAVAVNYVPPMPPARIPQARLATAQLPRAASPPAYRTAVFHPPKLVNYPRWEWCVPFARDVSGINVMGNAKDWWYAAAGHYARGHQPEPGSVLDFEGIPRMPLGHVSVVMRVVNSREILVEHANWAGPGSNHSGISRNIPVIDVSPNNDWTEVRVGLGPRYPGQYGSVYPTYGFIYDRPDNGVILANTPASAAARQPVEVAEAPAAAPIAVHALHHSLLDLGGK